MVLEGVFFHRNQGTGVFDPEQTILAPASGFQFVTINADLEGDGDMDILFISVDLNSNPSEGNIAWLENTDGLGAFGSENVISTWTGQPWPAFTIDLDNDGDLDVLSGNSWYSNAYLDNDITSFTHPDENMSAIINSTDHSVDLEVVNNADLTNFVPGVGISAGASFTASISDYSTEVIYTVTSDDGVSQDWAVNVTPVPDSPTLTLDAVDQSTASISWNKPEFTEGYNLEISTDPIFSSGFLSRFDPKLIPDNSANNESLSSLTSGTNYYARIRSFNKFDTESINSPTLQVLTIPSQSIANPASGITTNSFQATWTEASGATYYVVEVSLDDFATILRRDTVTNQLFADITELSRDTEYKYRVKSGNASGTSGFSNVIGLNTSGVAALNIELDFEDQLNMEGR